MPKNFSSIVLYSTTNPLQLPLKSLEEEFKVTYTSELRMYKTSKDNKMITAGIEVIAQVYSRMEDIGGSMIKHCKELKIDATRINQKVQ